MNRFVINGVLSEAQGGKRVLVVPGHMGEGRDLVERCASAEGVERVSRVNGRQRVDFNTGGAVIVRPPWEISRFSCELVVLDHPHAANPDIVADAVVASSPGGEVVRL